MLLLRYKHIFDRLTTLPHEERIETSYFDGLKSPADIAAEVGCRGSFSSATGSMLHPCGRIFCVGSFSTLCVCVCVCDIGRTRSFDLISPVSPTTLVRCHLLTKTLVVLRVYIY